MSLPPAPYAPSTPPFLPSHSSSYLPLLLLSTMHCSLATHPALYLASTPSIIVLIRFILFLGINSHSFYGNTSFLTHPLLVPRHRLELILIDIVDIIPRCLVNMAVHNPPLILLPGIICLLWNYICCPQA